MGNNIILGIMCGIIWYNIMWAGIMGTYSRKRVYP